MLRNSLKFTLDKVKTMLKPIKLQLISAQPSQCVHYLNGSVEKWINSLAEDEQKRVQSIQNEITLKRTEPKLMPRLEMLNIADYEILLDMSQNFRQQYYDYLYTLQSADVESEVKKPIQEKAFEEKIQLDLTNVPTKHIDYDEGKNTSNIMSWRHQKMYRAIRLKEPPLIFDCGFCETMTKFEIRDTAKHLKRAFAVNRLAQRPFVMHFCNVQPESLLWDLLKCRMPNIHKIPIQIHTADVTQIFPSEQLVYLSPDSENDMLKFNAEDRYIIGGIVDKGGRMPLTLEKAKKLNIRTVRLPLDKYMIHSRKALTLVDVTKILLELKQTQDWREALKHVPIKIRGS